MASLASAGPLAPDRTLPRVEGSWAVWALWLAYALAWLACLPWIGDDMGDPDNSMRLLQVHDLLAGQGWFDVRQYRMDPPFGAGMHWSRLVDLPLAGATLLFGLILPARTAEWLAIVLVPLLYLMPVLFGLRAAMRRLGLPPLAVIGGLALLPFFPLMPNNFAPYSIDHHVPQATCAVLVAALMLASSRWAPLAAGVAAAAWLAISLEALPLVAAAAAIYGLRYIQSADRSVASFLAALAVSAPVLSLATRPVAELAAWHCDILLPGHMAAFAAAALLAGALRLAPRQDQALGRAAGMALLPLACAPIALLSLGPCLADPFAGLDPLVRTYWHGFILEGLPVWRQPVSVAATLMWTFLLVPAGWLVAQRRGWATGWLDPRWLTLALLALAANAYALLLMREALVGQLLTVPFAAALMAHFLPQARAVPVMLPRVLATVACLTLATPAAVSAGGKLVDPVLTPDARLAGAMPYLAAGKCDYARLAALPPGHLFATLDAGPDILVRTAHTVEMSGYHRNNARMRDVIAAYVGGTAAAEPIVRASGADYVIACAAAKDTAIFRSARRDNLANRLSSGRPPAWLAPVAGFTRGPLRVYRVR